MFALESTCIPSDVAENETVLSKLEMWIFVYMNVDHTVVVTALISYLVC